VFSAKHVSASLGIALCLVLGWLGSALAQNPPLPPAVPGSQDPNIDIRGMSVTERPRPDYDPLGILMGGFIAYPSIGVSGAYNDNIYATDGGEKSDYIVDIRPALSIVSNWNNHALNIFGAASIRRYQDHSGEDTEDYILGANGRIDIVRDANLKLGIQAERLHEPRGSPDSVNGNHPTVYNLYTALAAYEHRFNRTKIMPSVTFHYYDFEDVSSSMGTINNDDRDRGETEGALRVDRQIAPRYSLFVRGAVNNRDYRKSVDDNGFNRDSYGFDLRSGVSIDITGILFGDIYVGYLEQFFDDPAFSDVSTFNAGMDLTWNVTPLTTIKGHAVRRVEDTTVGGASSYVASRVGLSVDHELLRNLILHTDHSFEWNDYENNSREDFYYNGEFSLQYLVNRYLSVLMGYNYELRNSNVSGQDYDRHLVFARLRGQY
jgi:hypothetical protein